ncbi:MAG: transporter substrate-binding domain-containing protein [Streptosporangiaceae bacterium]|jgi:polar amino acid transport system substrate-binding protein
MRRLVLATVAAVAAAGLAACGSSSSSSSSGGSTSASAASCTNTSIQHELYHHGVLTVATDNPVYTPWFVSNTPSNGKGYESAVAYAIASQLGFRKSQVVWVKEPFTSAYAPGPKNFDFDINEVSYTPQRASAVTFSNSYYPVRQSIVAMKGTPIATRHTPAQLKTYLYGDQIGTTGLTFIATRIQPTTTPKVFDTLAEASAALAAHRIAALVTDTPTAQYMATAQMKGAVLVAQFPSTGEHYGLVFHQGNPLVTCVNKAIAALTANGKLAALQKQYLRIYTAFPTIKP